MRHFLAKLMMGLIVLAGILSVTPHDDFLIDHSHSGTASSEFASTIPSDDGSNAQGEHLVTHCNGAAHFFTSASLKQDLLMPIKSGMYFLDENFPLSVATTPVNPPPIL